MPTAPIGAAQAHLADHAGIDRAKDRHGGVGQHDGNGDGQHPFVRQRADVGLGHSVGSARTGIRKWPVACAKGRVRLSCQASTWTDA